MGIQRQTFWTVGVESLHRYIVASLYRTGVRPQFNDSAHLGPPLKRHEFACKLHATGCSCSFLVPRFSSTAINRYGIAILRKRGLKNMLLSAPRMTAGTTSFKNCQRIEVTKDGDTVKITLQGYDASMGWYTSGELALPLCQLPLLEQALQGISARACVECPDSVCTRKVIPFPLLARESNEQVAEGLG